MPVGLHPSNPVELGDSGEDDEPRRVRVAKHLGTLRAGQAAWVKGSGVDAAIESGELLDITKTAQRRRLWRVGRYTYTDEAKARRVAKTLGQEAIEVA